jgi:hypothetical protein
VRNSYYLFIHIQINHPPYFRSDEVSDELIASASAQNVIVQEPEMYTIDTHCEISNDVDEKPMETLSDALIGDFMNANDPLDDVQSWVEPLHDSIQMTDDLSSQFHFQASELPQHTSVEPQQQTQQMQHYQQSIANASPLSESLFTSEDQHHLQFINNNNNNNNNSTHTHREFDKCIVCARVFKNPNSLEKHLRNVHTAHIIRPELTTSIKKSSEYRRIVLNKKPIKENVAKALVSKLNKKNQQNMEQVAASSSSASPSSVTNNNHNSNNKNAITTTSTTNSITAAEQTINHQSSHSQKQQQPYTQNTTTLISDGNWNGLAPISSSSDKSVNSHLENGNTIIIISNVEINPANTSLANNGYTFANYQASTVALPKLVPISGLKNQQQQQQSIMNEISKKNDASNEMDSEVVEKFSNTSPKVFIIDKEPSKTQHIQQQLQPHQNNIVSNNNNLQQQQQKIPKVAPSASPDANEIHQCAHCEKVFQKKYQLKRHQEIHENLFYFCPFCKRAPVKARSSLRKHFLKEHPENQDIWQASNFMSTLLKKYEKIKKSSHESQDSTKKIGKKESKKEMSKKKKEKLIMESSVMSIDNNNITNHHCEIINDQPLPQVGGIDTDGEDGNQQQHQIILSNLFLDPITLDEENNLIKYTLAGEDDFIMNGNGETSVVNMTHAGSIESYEMSEFSNFKSSFDEIQEKLDAELEFNNDQMIKWSDELNDDSSSILSSQSASNLSASDIGKSLTKQKNGFMLT